MNINKLIRLTLAFLLLVFSFSEKGKAYGDNSSRSPSNFSDSFNQPINASSFTLPMFLKESAFLPDLNLSPLTASAPQFTVPDFGDDVWTYNKNALQFDGGKVSYFAANIQTPLSTSIHYDLNKIRYDDNQNTPSAFQQTYQDSNETIFRRTRFDQISQPNDAHTRYTNYVQRNYPEAASNPLAKRPASLSPEPSQELILGFKETLTMATPQSKPDNSDLAIHSMQYDDDRYLNHYEGAINAPPEPLNFVVTMERGSEGELNSIQVQIGAENAPTASLEWKKMDGVNPDNSFKLFQDALPIPLLAGPRSTTRLNGVDNFEVPLKLNAEGHINPKQLPDSTALINLTNKSDEGIKFSAKSPDQVTSSFSIGNTVRNLWYRLTGRYGEVESMRGALNGMRASTPEKFVVSAGFRDPSHMSFDDLKTAMGRGKLFNQKIEENQPQTKPEISKETITAFKTATFMLNSAVKNSQELTLRSIKINNFVEKIEKDFSKKEEQQLDLTDLKTTPAMQALKGQAKSLLHIRNVIKEGIENGEGDGAQELITNYAGLVRGFKESKTVLENQTENRLLLLRDIITGTAKMDLDPLKASTIGTQIKSHIKQAYEQGIITADVNTQLNSLISFKINKTPEIIAASLSHELEAAFVQEFGPMIDLTEGMRQGAVKGDVIEDPTLPNIAGQVAFGLTPPGIFGDIRDIFINGGRMLKSGFKEHKANTALSAIAFIPLVGDMTKGALKSNQLIKLGGKASKVEKLMSESAKYDDILKAAKKFDNTSPAIREALSDFLKSGPPRTADEIVQLVKNKAPPPKVLARIVITDSVVGREAISAARPTMFVFDPSDIKGLSKAEVLKKTGWPEEIVKHASSKNISIALFEVDPNKFVVEVPTWGEIEKMVVNDNKFLKDMSAKGISKKELKVFRNGSKQIDIYADLEKRYGINKLFDGSGATKTYENTIGVREWWIRPKSSIKATDWNSFNLPKSILLTPWK